MLQKLCGFLAAALLFCCAAGPARCQDGQWQLVMPMGLGRLGLGAATGPDGRIYAIGGRWLAVAEAYDTLNNR
jgi:hypothetical protein